PADDHVAPDRHLVGEVDAMAGHHHRPRPDLEPGDGAGRAVVVRDGVEHVEAHHLRVVPEADPLATADDVQRADAHGLSGHEAAHAGDEVQVPDLGSVPEIDRFGVEDHEPDAHAAADSI